MKKETAPVPDRFAFLQTRRIESRDGASRGALKGCLLPNNFYWVVMMKVCVSTGVFWSLPALVKLEMVKTFPVCENPIKVLVSQNVEPQ